MPTQFYDEKFYDRWEWFKSNGENLSGHSKFSFTLKGRSDPRHYEKNRLILELCKKIMNTNDFTVDQKKHFENIIKTARPNETPSYATFKLINSDNLSKRRHFINTEDKIKLFDGNEYFLTSGWGTGPGNTIEANSDFMCFLSLLGEFKENEKYIVEVQCVKGGNEKVAQNGEKEMSNNSDQNQNKTLYPRQIIYFGAPGTSKSYTLNKDAEKKDEAGNKVFANQERVTFYPGYSYQQFVGTYKPFMDMDGDKISYKFVPGPLLRLLEKALKAEKAEKAKPQNENKEDTPAAENSTENQENGKEEKDTEKFLLIVEELNRAEAAAVFGDLFQLLDRNSDGSSEYPISVSEDLKQYLRRGTDKTDKTDEKDCGVWADVPENEQKKLYFPSNFYIWATMNSADQGVFPLDTAFKRRWDFKYFGINEAADKLRNDKQKFWNNLRTTINDALQEKLNLNEDKLLGPFFMKVEENIDEQTFWEHFCSKVLLYLYEDAARLNRNRIFQSKITYSQMFAKFAEFRGSEEKWQEDLKEIWKTVFTFDVELKGDYPKWSKAEAEEDKSSGSEADNHEATGEPATDNNSGEMTDEQ